MPKQALRLLRGHMHMAPGCLYGHEKPLQDLLGQKFQIAPIH
jgi:hypothetical protein